MIALTIRCARRESQFPHVSYSFIISFVTRVQVSTEVEGKLSDALLDFRAACMEHLTSYISAQSKGEAAEVNDDAFADNSDVEEHNVDAFLKGKSNKRQKT